MSYIHNDALVKRIKEYTDIAVGACKNLTDSIAENRVMYQGLPVSIEAHEFIKAISAKCPTYKYGITRECLTINRYDVTYKEVWVYREHDEYALGKIGFRKPNPETYKDQEQAYTVYSRVINNERFNHHSYAYYVASSKDLNTVVKKALKSLKLYTPVEIALLSKTSFAEKYKSEVYQASRKMNDVTYKMRHNGGFDELLGEMVLAVNDGYKFHSFKAQEIVAQYISAVAEADIQKNRSKNAYHVRLYEERGEQVASITPFDKFNTVSDGLAGTPSVVRINDLPEDIMGKLAVLSMVENDTYIDGVGMRISDATYWLARDETV